MTSGHLSPPSCAKCGSDDVLTRYHKQGCNDPKCRCVTCTYDSHHKEHSEHLHYVCRTCQWDWIGATADA